MPRLIPNFENRVGKLPKPANYSQALQPRFEAVRKAFHAIEDRVAAGMTEPGLVRINILHLTDPYKFRDEIADNGIGLDDGRYEAFHTIDTDFKRTRGSKGAGRLFWLDVFECVKGRCCRTLATADSQRESMRLDRRQEQAILRPLPP